MESPILKYLHIYLHTRDVYCCAHTQLILVTTATTGGGVLFLAGVIFDMENALLA